jgi:hypothetical protein
MYLAGSNFEDGLTWAGLGIYLPGFLMVIGSTANLFVPRELKARGPAVVALICSVLQFLLTFGLMVPFLNFLVPFLLLLPVALFHSNFIIFLKRIAIAAGREDLKRSAGRLLIGFVLVPVALWAVFAGVSMLVPDLPVAVGVATLAIVVTLMLGRYMLLIASVLSAIKPAAIQHLDWQLGTRHHANVAN